MNLPTETFGRVVVAHAPDELSGENSEALSDALTRLDHGSVVFDIDGAESFDSVALTALLEIQERLRDLGGDLKISAANHVNRKILEITRLDRQLEVFDSVIDAVKSFG